MSDKSAGESGSPPTGRGRRRTHVFRDWSEAWVFARATHPSDVRRVEQRTHLVHTFDEFLFEYVYVIVASGFRARRAAELTPKLVEAVKKGESLVTIFANRAKCAAIEEAAKLGAEWDAVRDRLRTVDDLEDLPRIGPITKFHLARNIGLASSVKPDLHLVRYADRMGYDSPDSLIRAVTRGTGIAPGVADFCLWIWLSHGGAPSDCCFGGHPLR